MMGKKNDTEYMGDERRSERRSIDARYSSVEFSTTDLNFLYQFKIRDTSASGMSILVKEDSDVLKHVAVGDILDMKYYLEDSTDVPVHLKTEIKHITKDVPKRFEGHYLIGLSIHESGNEEKDE